MSHPSLPRTADALRERVTELVSRVILECTGRTVVPEPHERLIEQGHLDSLSIGNLVLAIESEWNVGLDITDLDEETFGSIDAIARLLAERLPA